MPSPCSVVRNMAPDYDLQDVVNGKIGKNSKKSGSRETMDMKGGFSGEGEPKSQRAKEPKKYTSRSVGSASWEPSNGKL